MDKVDTSILCIKKQKIMSTPFPGFPNMTNVNRSREDPQGHWIDLAACPSFNRSNASDSVDARRVTGVIELPILGGSNNTNVW